MNTFRLPEEFVPTLDHLLQVAQASGVDRLAFVRRERPDQVKAVLVMMLSPRAIRELGPFLTGVARQCRLKVV